MEITVAKKKKKPTNTYAGFNYARHKNAVKGEVTLASDVPFAARYDYVCDKCNEPVFGRCLDTSRTHKKVAHFAHYVDQGCLGITTEQYEREYKPKVEPIKSTTTVIKEMKSKQGEVNLNTDDYICPNTEIVLTDLSSKDILILANTVLGYVSDITDLTSTVSEEDALRFKVNALKAITHLDKIKRKDELTAPYAIYVFLIKLNEHNYWSGYCNIGSACEGIEDILGELEREGILKEDDKPDIIEQYNVPTQDDASNLVLALADKTLLPLHALDDKYTVYFEGSSKQNYDWDYDEPNDIILNVATCLNTSLAIQPEHPVTIGYGINYDVPISPSHLPTEKIQVLTPVPIVELLAAFCNIQDNLQVFGKVATTAMLEIAFRNDADFKSYHGNNYFSNAALEATNILDAWTLLDRETRRKHYFKRTIGKSLFPI